VRGYEVGLIAAAVASIVGALVVAFMVPPRLSLIEMLFK
jgi:NAD/NADP transhydrogenase alpha subunit